MGRSVEQELRLAVVMLLKESRGDWFLRGDFGPEVQVDRRNGDLLVDGVRFRVEVVRKG